MADREGKSLMALTLPFVIGFPKTTDPEITD
jgi:hypothetical protein